MDKIKTKKEYDNLFKDSQVVSSRCSLYKTKKEKALEYAMHIREFEIELYWKRANYFWLFTTAIATAFFYSFNKTPHNYVQMFIIANIGFVFSLAWFFVNKGSKYWQNNWEKHVDALEDDFIGPLYAVVKVCEDKGKFIVREGKYSVSKINQIISYYVTILWLASILIICAKFLKDFGLFRTVISQCQLLNNINVMGIFSCAFFFISVYFTYYLIINGKTSPKESCVIFEKRNTEFCKSDAAAEHEVDGADHT